jgi:hypothetical protein
MGSILHPEDAAAGKNFTTAAAAEHYQRRRKMGWGVDPTRCTAYMTSSQALTFNIMAPLIDDRSWAARTLGSLLSMEIKDVSAIKIEHAPRRRSIHLGDMTMLDCWIELENGNGPLGLAIEIKYADRFNSRYLPVAENPKYRALAEKTGLWSLDCSQTQLRAINQLLRCHALATSMWTTKKTNTDAPLLAVVHHADDPSALKITNLYRSALRMPHLLKAMTLNHLLDAMQQNAPSQKKAEIVEELKVRYLDHSLSEAAWRNYQKSK